MRKKGGNPNPSPATRWKPGQSANPGGQAKGKRVSTWMVELGQLKPSEWPKLKDLPTNGRIALARLRSALQIGDADRATEVILERTEGNKPILVEINRTMSDEEIIKSIARDSKQR